MLNRQHWKQSKPVVNEKKLHSDYAHGWSYA